MINLKIDDELFSKAKNIARVEIDKNKIGLLQEHLLHRTLKFYYSALDESKQEIQINKMFADVKIDNQIYEIQTKQFNLMRDKLDTFLKDYEVTIVYPIAENKINHLFDENGVLLSEKKSPKHGSVFELCLELYKIKKYLKDEHLHFQVLMMDLVEERIVEKKKHYHSKGFTRVNQLPLKINQIYNLYNSLSFIELLKTFDLNKNFTSGEFAKKVHLVKNKASTVLNVLYEMNVVKRIGKIKNSYLYEIV